MSGTDHHPALFDVDLLPQTGDVRSVGELLVDSDYLARQLLLDVTGDDAGPLLRGWPAVVDSAVGLWRALPAGQSDAEGADPIARLVDVGERIRASLDTSRWPGSGDTDPKMGQIARTLAGAGGLVQRYGGEVPLERAAVRRDLEAARVRVMHGLYVAAHAVGVALHQHGRDRFQDEGRRARPALHYSPYAVAPTSRWIYRMAVCENAAGRYLSDGFTRTLASEAPVPVHEPDRLARALAGWDIQAHRTLAATPTPANLVLITRTQALITSTAQLVVDASTHDGSLALRTPADRLLPAITQAERAWTNLGGRWTDLAPPGARLEPHLARIAAEVRAACRELTHDPTGTASLDAIATRPDLDRGFDAILQALEAGPELAYAVSQKADDPDLTGPARALSIRAHNDAGAGLPNTRPTDADVVWVSVADILARRHVPLPAPVAAGLQAASAAVTDAATTAAVASQPTTSTNATQSRAQKTAKTIGPRSEPVPPAPGFHGPRR